MGPAAARRSRQESQIHGCGSWDRPGEDGILGIILRGIAAEWSVSMDTSSIDRMLQRIPIDRTVEMSLRCLDHPME
jgi:hypothetical protein